MPLRGPPTLTGSGYRPVSERARDVAGRLRPIDVRHFSVGYPDSVVFPGRLPSPYAAARVAVARTGTDS